MDLSQRSSGSSTWASASMTLYSRATVYLPSVTGLRRGSVHAHHEAWLALVGQWPAVGWIVLVAARDAGGVDVGDLRERDRPFVDRPRPFDDEIAVGDLPL